MGSSTKIGTINNTGSIGIVGNHNKGGGFARHDGTQSGARSEGQMSGRMPDRTTEGLNLNVIFVSSNCHGAPLGLDREFNRVHQHVSNANPEWARCLEHWPDVSLDQLATRIMRSTKMTILHFGGHGDRQGKLILRDHRGEPVRVDPKGLCRLLHQFDSRIRLIVLNACFSETLAIELAKSIDIVIGMTDAIRDEAAILFSQSFYEGLAMNLPVGVAFEIASGLVIARNPEDDTPRLLSNDRVDPFTITFGPRELVADNREL